MSSINPKHLKVDGGKTEEAWSYEESHGISVYAGRSQENASMILLTWDYLRNALKRREASAARRR